MMGRKLASVLLSMILAAAVIAIGCSRQDRVVDSTTAVQAGTSGPAAPDDTQQPRPTAQLQLAAIPKPVTTDPCPDGACLDAYWAALDAVHTTLFDAARVEGDVLSARQDGAPPITYLLASSLAGGSFTVQVRERAETNLSDPARPWLASLSPYFSKAYTTVATLTSETASVDVEGIEYTFVEASGQQASVFLPTALATVGLRAADTTMAVRAAGVAGKLRCIWKVTAFSAVATACFACLGACGAVVGCACAYEACCWAGSLLADVIEVCGDGMPTGPVWCLVYDVFNDICELAPGSLPEC